MFDSVLNSIVSGSSEDNPYFAIKWPHFSVRYKASYVFGAIRPTVTLTHYGFAVVFKSPGSSSQSSNPPSAPPTASGNQPPATSPPGGSNPTPVSPPPPSDPGPPANITIAKVEGKFPDYVAITNSGENLDLENFILKEGNNSFTFPAITIGAGHTIRVYFVSDNDSYRLGQAETAKGPEDLLYQGWGISSGEVVDFLDRQGNVLSQVQATD